MTSFLLGKSSINNDSLVNRKEGKYDAIIDKFLESKSRLVKVEIESRDAYYLRAQLKRRIDKRQLYNQIKTYAINGYVYLEKDT
jgi:hypothetical protein